MDDIKEVSIRLDTTYYIKAINDEAHVALSPLLIWTM